MRDAFPEVYKFVEMVKILRLVCKTLSQLIQNVLLLRTKGLKKDFEYAPIWIRDAVHPLAPTTLQTYEQINERNQFVFKFNKKSNGALEMVKNLRRGVYFPDVFYIFFNFL